MEPYAYQQEDIDWLKERTHALVGHEMGTGKTAISVWTVMEVFPYPATPNVLIICPTIVKPVWERHIRELTAWPYTVLDSKNRAVSIKRWQTKGGALIVHWESLRLIPELKKFHWDYVIADECHRAKNRKAQQTKHLKMIPAKHKLGLSGTPMINRPDELWSIFNWMYPKEFRGYHKFFDQFCQYEMHPQLGYKTVTGVKNIALLHEILGRIMIRRTKKEVLPDLPDKYYDNIITPMSSQQKLAHEEMKKRMMTWVKEQEGEDGSEKLIAAPVVIAQLTRMRQFATAHCVVDDDGQVVMTEPSNKLDALMAIIDDNPDEKVVVFAYHKGVLELLRKRLDLKGLKYEIMTGDTKDDNAWVRFQNDDNAQFFLATISKGSEGIDLFTASTVVFLERSWSNKDNWQAEDRLHRNGQTNAVQVINLLSENSVDEYIGSRLQTKAQWFKDVIEGVAPREVSLSADKPLSVDESG